MTGVVEIAERVKAIIGSLLFPRVVELRNFARISDVGLRPIDIVELSLRLEDEFDIALTEADEDALSEGLSIAQLACRIEQLIAERRQ